MNRAVLKLWCHVTFIPRNSPLPLVKSRWHGKRLNFQLRFVNALPLKPAERCQWNQNLAQYSEGKGEFKKKQVQSSKKSGAGEKFAKVLPLLMDLCRLRV